MYEIWGPGFVLDVGFHLQTELGKDRGVVHVEVTTSRNVLSRYSSENVELVDSSRGAGEDPLVSFDGTQEVGVAKKLDGEFLFRDNFQIT